MPSRAARVLMLALLMTDAASAAASAAPITGFPTGNATPAPGGLVDGGDGHLWFVDTNAIGRISGDGIVKEFPLPTALPPGANLHAVVPGANGVMWFDVNGMAQEIGKLTPDGAITNLPPGTNGLNAEVVPGEMTTGPDGTVWFTDSGGGMAPVPAIGRITPAGVIKEFTYPFATPTFESLTTGADGNIWITDRGDTPAIVKVTPDGTITPYTIGAAPNTMPDGLTPGPDNKMWFTDEGSPAAIGSVAATNAYGTATGATQTFKTAHARTIKHPSTPTPTPTVTTTTTVGDHRIALVTPSPSACTAKSKSLTIKLSSSAIRGSKAAKVRFVSASLFVHRGASASADQRQLGSGLNVSLA